MRIKQWALARARDPARPVHLYKILPGDASVGRESKVSPRLDYRLPFSTKNTRTPRRLLSSHPSFSPRRRAAGLFFFFFFRARLAYCISNSRGNRRTLMHRGKTIGPRTLCVHTFPRLIGHALTRPLAATEESIYPPPC